MSCLSCSLCSMTNKKLSNLKSNENSQITQQPHQQHSNSLQTNTSLKPSIAKEKKKNPNRPSIMEIERAIGAGRFRDIDPREMEEEKNVKFDIYTMSFPNKFEIPLQKKLREMGEWLIENTETKFRMSGKATLKLILFWILPIWVMSILIAAGVIELPFIKIDDVNM